MRELEGVTLEGENLVTVHNAGKENFKTFARNLNLADKQVAMMYEFMNTGEIGFLKTYVDNINLSEVDATKMKRLIDEWPQDIKISYDKKEQRADWIPNPESQKLLDQATQNEDGSYEMISEGPPVEKVDMINHLRQQSILIAAKDDLVNCIISLETTREHKHTLLKWLENKHPGGKPRSPNPEKIPQFCEFIGLDQAVCDKM